MNDTKQLLSGQDRRIAAALLVHPRASWELIAAVLDVPLATVTRRGSGLLGRGDLHVVGMIDVLASGTGMPVLLRVQCHAGQIRETADALAKWDIARTVHMLSGSADCYAELSVPSLEFLADMLLDLPRMLPGAASTHSYLALRRFTTAHSWDPQILTRNEVDALRGRRQDRWTHEAIEGSGDAIGGLDAKLLDALATDGRSGWVELARSTGASERTVRRHTQMLMEAGILRMRTLIDPSIIGFNVLASLWLRIDPRYLTEVGNTLAKHPSVLLLVATTGEFNLSGEIAVTSNRALYDFLTQVLGSLPGVEDVDLSVELLTMKRAGERHTRGKD